VEETSDVDVAVCRTEANRVCNDDDLQVQILWTSVSAKNNFRTNV
jgi:hypothetical protein